MYTSSFQSIETSGDLAFNGFVKGTYGEKQMPAFNVNLIVKDAMFKYPDLPTPVNNINLDLLVDNKDGVIENTLVNLKQLHMEFGSNPLDAKAVIENLHNYKMDANVVAKLNLAELTKMFPMEGLEMKGNYSIDLKAKGIYDSVKNIIPAIHATMSLANGYVKSNDFPLPLQDLKFHSTVKNSSGKMQDTEIVVKDFSMLMDGEKFSADLLLRDLVDYTWDLKVNGAMDLEKITKVFPMEGMNLAGKIKADLATKGKYSDLQAEKYDRLPTSGTASLSSFKYSAKDLPYDVAIDHSSLVFDPKKIELQNMVGTIGKSDFDVSGSVLNYLGYVFGKGETIKGIVNFNSNNLDLNQFMTESEETVVEDTAAYGVIPVPRDIDFILKSSIKNVRLMDYKITNATGDIIVKDGIANLNGLKFNMLGGAFVVNGTYNTHDLNHPKYDFALKIENLSIQQAASSFTLVQTYAPIAGLVKGNFSTEFKISGELLQTMMPNLATVNGAGLVKIAQAALTQSKIVSGVTSLTNLDNTDNVTLKDVLMSAQITNGRLSVKPFDVKFGDYKTAVSGSTGLDGSIDYSLKMNVPAGKVGSQVQSFINKNTGANNPTDIIPLTIGLGGSYNEPKFALLADEQKAQATEAVTNVAKEEGQKALQEAVKGTDAEKYVNSILGGGTKDSTTTAKPDSTNAATNTDAQKKVEEEAKKKIQNLLKKKN
ncbi:MAG TPA: AsmA-like C-terminal region-containing protein, partial [Cyclobacteriaceae bacterium]|nr:AsmA-like C-terminal region-containing protein [Cyclobacteriaceae bacterium]